MSYELVKVTIESDWREYHSLRREVLWEARGLRGYDDKRPGEYIAANTALLLKLNGRSIGTTRLDNRGDQSGIGGETGNRGHSDYLLHGVGP